jgi:hypothetical protein
MNSFKEKKLTIDVEIEEIKMIENHIASILGRLNKLEEPSIKPKPPTYSYAVPAKNVVGVPKPDGWKLTTDLSGVATWKVREQ